MRRQQILAGVIATAVVLTACAGSGGEEATTTEAEAASTTTQAAAPTTAEPEATTTTTEAAGDGGASITIVNFNFSGPATVPVGTTVTATNEDTFGHTWTSDDDVWDSGTLSQGDSFEFTFDEPGEYPYLCRIHPTQMTGTITVTG